MSPEMYAIFAVAIALAGLILNGHRTLGASVGDLRRELNDVRREIDDLRNEMHRDITALGERVARLEGLVEGLRDTVAGKAA